MNQSPINYGTRIGNESTTLIPADAKIRPLRDQIIVEPLDWQPSKTILVAGTHTKPLRGIVRAVGPGVYPKKYDGRKGRRTKSWDSKAFRPTDVKVGDIVELGGLELGSGTASDPHGYLHKTIIWGTTEMVVCREEDIAIVRDDLKCGHLLGEGSTLVTAADDCSLECTVCRQIVVDLELQAIVFADEAAA